MKKSKCIRKHNKKVDALFINPPSPDRFIYIRDTNRHGRSSWERMVWPQTNLAYLAAVTDQIGLSVDIIDCVADNVSWPLYEKLVRSSSPKYCIGNIISATYRNDIKALKTTKDLFQTITIGLGPHLTDSPDRSLMESPGLDFILLHEAEETLKELLETLEKGNPEINELTRIRGLAFIPERLVPGASSVPVVTDQRPFIDDLDSLPQPRHDLLPLDKYWSPLLGNYTFVQASRGCYYKCIFCRQAVMWQWKYRKRSGEKIAEEAIYVASLGINNILFHADTFTLSEDLVNDLCDALISAGRPFKWACNTHVKNLFQKPDLVKKMKEAGCWMIAIGIESGDNQVLQNIQKQITREQAESVVRMIDATGIQAWGYFVLGLPGDTKETLEKTISFALSLPLKIAKFDIGTPYPGTKFFHWAKDQGYLKINKYEDYDQNASAVVDYPNLSRTYIKSAIRRANIRFYLRPAIAINLLRHIVGFAALKAIALIIRDQFQLLRDTNPNKPS